MPFLCFSSVFVTRILSGVFALNDEERNKGKKNRPIERVYIECLLAAAKRQHKPLLTNGWRGRTNSIEKRQSQCMPCPPWISRKRTEQSRAEQNRTEQLLLLYACCVRALDERTCWLVTQRPNHHPAKPSWNLRYYCH